MAPTTIVSWLLTVARPYHFSNVLTHAVGSTLSRAITQPDLNLVRALISVMVLIGVEWVITALIAESAFCARLFRAPPVLLVFRGELCWRAMRENRISELGIYQALRGKGIASLEGVEALILEGNGSFSFVARLDDDAPRDVLMHVPDYALVIGALGEKAPMREKTARRKEHDQILRRMLVPAVYSPKHLPIDLDTLKNGGGHTREVSADTAAHV